MKRTNYLIVELSNYDINLIDADVMFQIDSFKKKYGLTPCNLYFN